MIALDCHFVHELEEWPGSVHLANPFWHVVVSKLLMLPDVAMASSRAKEPLNVGDTLFLPAMLDDPRGELCERLSLEPVFPLQVAGRPLLREPGLLMLHLGRETVLRKRVPVHEQHAAALLEGCQALGEPTVVALVYW